MSALSMQQDHRSEAPVGIVSSIANAQSPYVPDETETELLLAAQAGDKQAFLELCNCHIPALERRILNIVKNPEDAEDVLQESLMRAYMHCAKFRGSCKFSSWLMRIAINSALMVLRKRKVRNETPNEAISFEDGSLETWEFLDKRPNPEEQYRIHESAFMLQRAVEKLRPTYQRVVNECYGNERSLEEAAELLGISVPAAKSRLNRGRALLRHSLKRRRESTTTM